MTGEASFFLAMFFANIWKFYVSWNIPGTNFTPAELSFFVLSLIVIIRFLKRFSSVSDASFGNSSSKTGE